jgi:type II secretory pathway pseudopilin PulG
MAREQRSAFTFLEIIIILLITGILGAVAIPKFISFREEAELAVEKQQVGSAKVGINSYFIHSVTSGRVPQYPPALDPAASAFASAQNPFFTSVIESPGVINPHWRKLASSIYQGPSGLFYFYYPTNGAFGEREVVSKEILSLLKMTPEDITMDFINKLGLGNTIDFPDGRKLIGGAAVLTPKSPEPSLTGVDTKKSNFSGLSGNIQAQITGEYAGYATAINFGYYTIDPSTGQKVLHEIFKGSNVTGNTKDFNVNSGQVAGFYFTTPQGPGYTYYTQQSSNPDNKQHLKVYENEGFKKMTFGLEDLYGGGDGDFQDMIITLSY